MGTRKVINYLEDAGARIHDQHAMQLLSVPDEMSLLTAKEHGALAGRLVHNFTDIAGLFSQFAQGSVLDSFILVDETGRKLDNQLSCGGSELLLQQELCASRQLTDGEHLDCIHGTGLGARRPSRASHVRICPFWSS